MIRKEGFLVKEGGHYHTYRKRFFRLNDNSLSYYRSPSENEKMVGIIQLVEGYYLDPIELKTMGRHSFSIRHETRRSYYLRADSEEEKHSWMTALTSVLEDDAKPTTLFLTRPTFQGYLSRWKDGTAWERVWIALTTHHLHEHASSQDITTKASYPLMGATFEGATRGSTFTLNTPTSSLALESNGVTDAMHLRAHLEMMIASYNLSSLDLWRDASSSRIPFRVRPLLSKSQVLTQVLLSEATTWTVDRSPAEYCQLVNRLKTAFPLIKFPVLAVDQSSESTTHALMRKITGTAPPITPAKDKAPLQDFPAEQWAVSVSCWWGELAQNEQISSCDEILMFLDILEGGLSHAVKAGDEATAKQLIECGVPIDSPGKDGRTALHMACLKSSESMVRLLAPKSNLKLSDVGGNTSVHLTLRAHHPQIARILITEFSADPTAPNLGGISPLMVAASEGDEESARLLIKHGADVNARDKQGRTALFHSVLKDFHHVVRMLAVDLSADPTLKSYQGDSPLSTAIRLKRMKMVETLMDLKRIRADSIDSSGNSPLHVACEVGLYDAVMMLLSLDSDVALNRPNTVGETPFLVSCRFGHVEIASELMKRGVDMTVKTANGQSCVHLAVQSQDVRLLNLLVADHKVSVDADDEDGMTGLHYAALHGSVPVVKELIKLGAQLEVKNKKQQTPLMVSSLKAKLPVLVALHQHGANLYAADCSGLNSLFYAVRLRQLAMIQFLVDNGGLRILEQSESIRHDTVLHQAACMQNSEEIVSILLAGGANVNSVSKVEQTPLHAAVLKENWNVCLLLIDHPSLKVDAADSHGNSAAHYAVLKRADEVLVALMKKHADLLLRNVKGLTPKDLATGHIIQVIEGNADIYLR